MSRVDLFLICFFFGHQRECRKSLFYPNRLVSVTCSTYRCACDLQKKLRAFSSALASMVSFCVAYMLNDKRKTVL